MVHWLTSNPITRYWAGSRRPHRGWRPGVKAGLARCLGVPASLSDLPLPARLYLLCVWATAAGLLWWGIQEFTWSTLPLSLVILLVMLIAGLGSRAITLRPGEVEITLEVSGSIAAIMLLPPPSIPLIVFLSKSLAELRFERPWYKKAFNISQWVIVDTTMAWIYYHAAGDGPMLLDSVRSLVAIVILWVGHHTINTGLVTLAVSFAVGLSPFAVWRSNYRDVVYHVIFTAPLGTLIALLIQDQPLAVAFVLPPLFIMYRALRLTTELRQRTVEALMAFANSIDARDPSTYQHSQRVGELAGAIARQMGLPPDEVETVSLSARVHDLGKVGIPDAILFNPDELSDEEYDKIKEHPVTSARIVQSFPLFSVGHDIIKYHHERYDGEGYPEKLAGDEIPLGARILAVADAYDAMISDRPYRGGLSPRIAVERIIEEKGGQFDPDVVDAFLEVVGATPELARIEVVEAAGPTASAATPAFSINGRFRPVLTDDPPYPMIPTSRESRK